MKRADELGAKIDPEGNVIEGTWTTASNNGRAEAEATTLLEELVSQYGADAVLAANGGAMPDPNDQAALTTLAVELAGAKA
jgi:hypothetical protein